jgi:hypothetical protein
MLFRCGRGSGVGRRCLTSQAAVPARGRPAWSSDQPLAPQGPHLPYPQAMKPHLWIPPSRGPAPTRLPQTLVRSGLEQAPLPRARLRLRVPAAQTAGRPPAQNSHPRIQAPQSRPRPAAPPVWKAPARASRPASWRPRPPSTTPTRRGRPTWQASGPRSPPLRRPQARRASCPSAWPSSRPTPQRGPAGWRGASACS